MTIQSLLRPLLFLMHWLSVIARSALVLLVMTAFFIYFFGNHRVIHAEVQNITDHADSASINITFPYSNNSAYSKGKVPKGKEKKYRFTVHTMGYPGQRLLWHLTPDGCIESIAVNHKAIDIDTASRKLFCNQSRGFVLDLSQHMLSGHNRIDMTLRDESGGIYGLKLKSAFSLFGKHINAEPNLMVYIAMWLFGALLYQLGLNRITVLVGAFCTYMYMWDFMSIPPTKYAPDWWGHIPYIRYMFEHWLPPPSGHGWETYHPPLYYYIAAIAGKIGMMWNYSPLSGARVVTFVSLLLFNMYGLLFFREIIKRQWLLNTCVCILLFWPLQHILVGRITNEILSYTIWAAAYYHLLCWYRHKQARHFIFAMISCGIMMLVKVSAIVPIGTAGFLVLLELWREKNNLRDFMAPRILLAIAFMLLCTGLTFGRTYYYKTYHTPHMGYITSNIYQDPFYDEIRSKATWQNMIRPDINDLMTRPYVGVLGSHSSRELFWNTYIKTLHFGFYNFGRGVMASRINTMLAILLACTVIIIPFAWRYNNTHLFLGFSLLIGITAQITNRITTKTVPASDGRLTFPIIILLIGWLGYFVESQLDRKRYISGCTIYAALAIYMVMVIQYALLFTNIYRLLPSFLWW
jgi:hypothetical protein